MMPWFVGSHIPSQSNCGMPRELHPPGFVGSKSCCGWNEALQTFGGSSGSLQGSPTLRPTFPLAKGTLCPLASVELLWLLFLGGL